MITNSDDSYRRLEEDSVPVSGRIHIVFDRGKLNIAVIDDGEGLTHEEMKTCFTEYGAATSGLQASRSVRGYFGKGIKDVLFPMSGRVKSIKDGRLYIAKFRKKRDGTPIVSIGERGQTATDAIREAFDILGNGTRVEFEIPKKLTLTRHGTLLKGLTSFYMLRMITSSQDRAVILTTLDKSGGIHEDKVEYIPPLGRELSSETFEILYLDFEPFLVELTIKRADSPLDQRVAEREGGLLIVDEDDIPLDLTLFRYDRDDNAARLFGLVKIWNFRALLQKEEHVLTDTRDGLDLRHPFCEALVDEIEKRLEPIVEDERRHQRQGRSQLTRKQRERLDYSIKRINRLLETLTSQAWPVGGDIGNQDDPPRNGLEFRPKNVNLYEGQGTRVLLRINPLIIQSGSMITLDSSSDDISIDPGEFELVADPDEPVTNEVVVLTGNTVGIEAVISATAEGRRATLYASVIPELYPEPDNGFAFMPDVTRIPENTRRYAHLYLDRSIAIPGDMVYLEIDNPHIQLGIIEHCLVEADFRHNVAKVSIPLRGSGIGQEATLNASVNATTTSLSIEVVSLRERRRGRSGLITAYDFEHKENSRSRSRFEEETGVIWVNRSHPTVGFHYGDLGIDEALKHDGCQALLAEVILDEVAWIARTKMISSGAAMYINEAHSLQEDLASVEKFKYDYGADIYSWVLEGRALA